MGYVIPIFFGIVTGSLVQGALFWFTSRRQLAGANAPVDDAIHELKELEQSLRSNILVPAQAISVESFSFLQGTRDNVQSQLGRLAEEHQRITERLRTQQASLEELELAQQETKTTREEDEAALRDIQSQFEQVREEASRLEEQLAASQQQLEQLLQQVELTKAQREYLEDLQNVMRSAGETLRQLLDEYRDVEERLNTVTKQQQDLELEYSTLVEKLLS